METEIERAEQDMTAAAARLKSGATQGNENRYADAYQRLVRLGRRQQLRERMRG